MEQQSLISAKLNFSVMFSKASEVETIGWNPSSYFHKFFEIIKIFWVRLYIVLSNISLKDGRTELGL